MRSPLSPPPPWLRGLGLGALLAALGRASAEQLGGTPVHMVGAASALALGLVLAAALEAPALAARLPRRADRLLPFAPALALLALDPLLGLLGRAHEALGLGLGQIRAALLVGAAALLGLALRGGPRPAPLAVALGLALGAPLPAWGAALGAGLLLAATSAARSEPARVAPLAERLTRALAVAAQLAAGVYLWAALRPALDPTPRGALIAALAGLLLAAATRRFGGLGHGGALWIASMFSLAGWAALEPAPRALDALATLAGGRAPLEALALLGLPLALAGALTGALIGASARGLASVELGLALAGGGLLGLALLDRGGLLLPALGGLLAFALMVAGPSRRAQLGGVLALALSFGLAGWAPAPAAERLLAGRHAQLQDPAAMARDAEIRAQQRAAWSGWSEGLGGAVRAPEQTWSAREQAEAETRALVVELDGSIAERPSRAAAAEALAGLLGGLLAPAAERALLLGDETGQAARLLAPAAGRMVVSVAAPEALRAVAALDPEAERAWLLPGVDLQAAHPALTLRLAATQDLIVDIARTPWTDGARAALVGGRVGAAARRLGPEGVYVLCLHLGRLGAGAPQAVVAEVLRRFPTVQLWLPPAGADSLIVVGSRAPLPLARLRERAERRRDALDALSLDSALDLAGLAVAGTAEAAAWVEATPPAALGLADNRASFARPLMHLSSLASHTGEPAAIWSLTDPSEGAPLALRVRARRAFLEVLGEAATGDLEAVFERSRLLLTEAGAAGSAALDPLLEPHLRASREALARARQEGLGSTAWETARAEAVTAQMLNPSSPLPVELLAEIALAQGNARVAREQFEAALALEPERPSALTGLARAWRLLGEAAQAEAALRSAARVAPRSAAAWQNLGVFLLETGRLAEAEDCLRRAAALDEQSAAPHLALAELALSTGDATRALVEVERALRMQSSGYAWYLRGRAHFELEQIAAAEEDFKNAVLADPGLAEARGAIGHIQALNGDLQAAAESFRAVLVLQPENAAARENLKRVSELLARRGAAEATPQQ